MQMQISRLESSKFKIKVNGGEFRIGENDKNPSIEKVLKMTILTPSKLSNLATGGKKIIHIDFFVTSVSWI